MEAHPIRLGTVATEGSSRPAIVPPRHIGKWVVLRQGRVHSSKIDEADKLFPVGQPPVTCDKPFGEAA